LFKNIDYDTLVPLIFRKLRGERTQKFMDGELELAPSTYHRIESGYLKLKLDALISMIYQLDKGNHWEKALQEIANIQANYSSAFSLVGELLGAWGEPNSETLENYLGFSTTKWWRIKNAKSILTAKDFFKLFEDRTGKLEWFLQSVFGVEFSNSKEQSFVSYSDFTALVMSDPSYTVLTALMDSELNFASSREELIRKFSGVLELDFSETEKRLLRLEKMGLCKFEGNRYIVENHKLEIRTELGLGKKVFDYITEFMSETQESNFRRKSYRISAVSEACMHSIIEEQKRFYKKIHELIENDTDVKDRILFFQSGLVEKKK
jgi:hypothetical protein